jgi:radical SAM superfamily enzyme YgiQ (UPF0313 family)
MELGMAAGIRSFRLYFMIGLPLEEMEDIQAIVDLACKLRTYLETKNYKARLTLSINPFIPKPFTPFQWLPMAEQSFVESALKLIRKSLKPYKNIEIIAESPRSAYVQGVLARGDRRVGQALYDAHRAGGPKAFRCSLKALGLQEEFYLYRQRTREEIFPWNVLDIGCRREYLYEELCKARKMQATVQCFDGCRRCGVCGD